MNLFRRRQTDFCGRPCAQRAAVRNGGRTGRRERGLILRDIPFERRASRGLFGPGGAGQRQRGETNGAIAAMRDIMAQPSDGDSSPTACSRLASSDLT